MSFLLFLVEFFEKGTKSANLGNFRVLHRDVGIPRSNVSPCQGMACPRQGVACTHRGTANKEAWTSLR